MNKGLDIKFDTSFITLEKQFDLFVAILATFYSELNTLFCTFRPNIYLIALAVYNYKVQPCLVSYMNPAKTAIYTNFCLRNNWVDYMATYKKHWVYDYNRNYIVCRYIRVATFKHGKLSNYIDKTEIIKEESR